MVRRRAKTAGITTEVSNHTFRGTGITAYLENGGTLEKARQMAAHASTRTTQLYDGREDNELVIAYSPEGLTSSGARCGWRMAPDLSVIVSIGAAKEKGPPADGRRPRSRQGGTGTTLLYFQRPSNRRPDMRL
jgi:hypothetical protein